MEFARFIRIVYIANLVLLTACVLLMLAGDALELTAEDFLLAQVAFFYSLGVAVLGLPLALWAAKKIDEEDGRWR